MSIAPHRGPSRLGQAALERFVHLTGRSWWQAGYADGRVVNEWDSIPSIAAIPFGLVARQGPTSRWEELDKRGLRAVRLLTPIGKIAHLETTREGALFQFKVGGVTVGAHGAAAERWCDAHVIGKLIDSEGDCVIMAFEYGDQPRLVGPLLDSVHGLAYRQVGPLGIDALGLKL